MLRMHALLYDDSKILLAFSILLIIGTSNGQRDSHSPHCIHDDALTSSDEYLFNTMFTSELSFSRLFSNLLI